MEQSGLSLYKRAVVLNCNAAFHLSEVYIKTQQCEVPQWYNGQWMT